jgi:hypothetical protein
MSAASNINLLPEDLRGADDREREAARKRGAEPVSWTNPGRVTPPSAGTQPQPSLWARLFRRTKTPKAPAAPKPTAPREAPVIPPLHSPVAHTAAPAAPAAPAVPPLATEKQLFGMPVSSFAKPDVAPTSKPAPASNSVPAMTWPKMESPATRSFSSSSSASVGTPKPPKLPHKHWWRVMLDFLMGLFPAFGSHPKTKPTLKPAPSVSVSTPAVRPMPAPTIAPAPVVTPVAAPTPTTPSAIFGSPAPVSTPVAPITPPATPTVPTPTVSTFNRPVSAPAVSHPADVHPVKERIKNRFGINLMPKDLADAAAPELQPKVLAVVAASVIGIALVGVLYLAITAYQLTIVRRVKALQTENAKIEQQIKSYQDARRSAEGLQRQLTAVMGALRDHVYWTKFFRLLEQATVADVSYQGLAMAGTQSVALQAIGRDFESVAQQLVSFERATTLVRTATVNGATAKINPATGQIDHVEFVINLELQPNVFLNASSTQPQL